MSLRAPDAFVLDPRQREIAELLKLIGPEPAAFFTDACRIVAGAAGVSAQTHLAAHLLREIEGRLHEVLEPMRTGEMQAKIVAAGENEESHRAKIEAAGEMLALDEQTLRLWIEYARPLHGFAHRTWLSGPRDRAAFREHFDKGQGVLLGVLRRLKAIYAESRPLIQELAAVDRPTKKHLTSLRNRVPHGPVTLREFFSTARLEWFLVLRDAGYFANPPPLEVNEEGRVSYSEWPAGRFLVRAATVQNLQDEVGAILSALETGNPEARDVTVEAALAMPPARAARLAPKIAGYAGASESWWIPRRSEELVTHLVKGGEVAAALEVTKSLLAPAPRTADWQMRHAFTDLVPKLFPAVGLEGLALLRDLLAEELTAEGRVSANDLSTIWRESIVGGPDMRRRDLLVTALNEAAEALVGSGTATLREVVETLASDERAIFSRIALHLTANHPEPDVAAEWLGDEDVFRDFKLEREYAELARAAFTELDAQVKERVFGWIEHGPTWRPHDLPEDDVEEYDAQWRLRQLRRIPELPTEWQRRFDDLVDRFGDPGDPLARTSRVVWSGTRSPKSKEELLELTDDELLDFLGGWRPDDDWFGPSLEGLANELSDAAADEPERFSRLLPPLTEREPTYARNIAYGLLQAVRDGGVLAWRPILEFACRILEPPARLKGRDSEGDDVASGLEWARLEVARPICSGLGRKLIPEELRDEVWQVISALAEDDDPTVESEEERERGGMPAEILSLNAVRACAIEAAIRFAAWSADHEDAVAGQPATLPENARELFDRHLDPERERTRAVQAVFGRHFNQLYFLDPEWTARRATAILPDGRDRAGHHDTAWRAFIAANRFCPTSWDALEPQYRRAVEGLAGARFEEEHVSDLDTTHALLAHLLDAYLSDLIELSDSSLLGVFVAMAPLRLRRAFLEMIGTELSSASSVSASVLTKLKELWEWRAERVFSEGDATELAGFDWWFGSGKMPHEWSVEQLLRVLEAGGGVTFNYVVTQRLPDLAAKDLPSAVRIVAALVEHAYSPEMVLSAREPFRTVLAAALASGDGQLVSTARATISRLYAERHTEFADLLDQ